MSFDILCHLTFCVIQHSVSFHILCHFKFSVISHFVSFYISCDLSDLIHHSNNCHQSHHSIYVQVVVEDRCVLKKWVRARIVIGQYHVKSSFGYLIHFLSAIWNIFYNGSTYSLLIAIVRANDSYC